ncbi:MAG: autotransporter domain-containing protein [Proteobacteria bacterium]|nr:autotransporter domain-containing protein [Pseudomonadota bacterium]
MRTKMVTKHFARVHAHAAHANAPTAAVHAHAQAKVATGDGKSLGTSLASAPIPKNRGKQIIHNLLLALAIPLSLLLATTTPSQADHTTPTLQITLAEDRHYTEGENVTILVSTTNGRPSPRRVNEVILLVRHDGANPNRANTANEFFGQGRTIDTINNDRLAHNSAGAFVLSSGQSNITFTLTSTNDSQDEDSTTITVYLITGDRSRDPGGIPTQGVRPIHYQVDPSRQKVQVTIADDDPPVAIRSNNPEASVYAGGELDMTVFIPETASLGTPPFPPDTIYLRYTDGNGTPIADLSPTSVILAGTNATNKREVNFKVPITLSHVGEINAKIIENRGPGSNASLPFTAYRLAPSRYANRTSLTVRNGSLFAVADNSPPRHLYESDTAGYNFTASVINGVPLPADIEMQVRFLQLGGEIAEDVTFFDGDGNLINIPTQDLPVNEPLVYRFTLPRGSTNFTAQIGFVDDGDIERPATITMTHLASDRYGIADSRHSASITVHDNDPQFSLTPATPQIAGGSNATFTITADQTLTTDKTVYFAIEGDAIFNQSFTTGAMPTNVTLPADTTTASFSVPTITNAAANATSGILTARLIAGNTALTSPLTPYRINPANANASVLVVPAPPPRLRVRRIAPNPTLPFGREGDPLVFRVETVNGSMSGRNVEVNLRMSQNGGNMFDSAVRFQLSNGSSGSFLPPNRRFHRDFNGMLAHNQTGFTITAHSHDDKMDEVSGVVTVDIRGGIGYEIETGRAQITVLDDDPLFDVVANTSLAFAGENVLLTLVPSSKVFVDQSVYHNVTDANNTLFYNGGSLRNFREGQANVTINLTVRDNIGVDALDGRAGIVNYRLFSDIDNLNASTPYRVSNTSLNISVYPTPPEIGISLDGGIQSRIYEGQRTITFIANVSNATPLLRPTLLNVRITQPDNMITNFGFTANGRVVRSGEQWEYPEWGNSQTFNMTLPRNTNTIQAVMFTTDDEVDDAFGNLTVEILPANLPDIDYVIAEGKGNASILMVDDDPEVSLFVANTANNTANNATVIAGNSIEVILATDSPTVADNVVQLAYEGAGDFLLTTPSNITIPSGVSEWRFSIPTNPNSARGNFSITVVSRGREDLADLRTSLITDPITPYRVSPTSHSVSVFVQRPPELALGFTDGLVGNQRIINEGDPPPEIRIRTTDDFDFVQPLVIRLAINQTKLEENVTFALTNQDNIPLTTTRLTTTTPNTTLTTLAITTLAGDSEVRIAPSRTSDNPVDSPVGRVTLTLLPSGDGNYTIGDDNRTNFRSVNYRLIDDDPAIGIRTGQQQIRQGETMNFTTFVEDNSPLIVNNRVRVEFTGANGASVANLIASSSHSDASGGFRTINNSGRIQVFMPIDATSTDFQVRTNTPTSLPSVPRDAIHVINATVLEFPGAAPITPYRAARGQDSVQVVVAGADAPTVSVADARTDEDAGVLNFVVTLSRAASETISIPYVTTGITAQEGSDYVKPGDTMTLPAGQTQVVLPVRLLDDDVLEGNETFTLTLLALRDNGGLSGEAVIGDGTAIGTIVDDEEAPKLSVADITVDENATQAVFNITIDAVHYLPLAFDFTTQGGLPSDGRATEASTANATHPADFTGISGRATIPAGNTSYTLAVQLLDDTADEPPQTFTLTLSNPENAMILDGEATASLIDNDPTARLEIATRQNGSEAGTPIEFAITSDRLSEFAITASVVVADGTAVSPSDYTATNFTFAGRRGVSPTNPLVFDVAVEDDGLDEADETLTASITSSSNATSNPSQIASATIIDDDAPPFIAIIGLGLDPKFIRERETGRFSIQLNATSGKPIRFDYATRDGTATAGLDYTPLNGTAVIPPGDTNFNLTIGALRDTISDEADETFSIVLTNIENATSFGPPEFNITILNAPLPTLTIADNQTQEGNPLVFHPRINFAWDEDMVVRYQLVAGTAGAADFNRLPGDTAGGLPPDCDSATAICRLVIPANTTQRQFPPIQVLTAADLLDETDETFRLVILSATNIVVARNATGTIIDNDPPAGVGVTTTGAGTVTEGDEAVFTIALNVTSGKNVRVAYATGDGSATAGDDYTGRRGNLTIVAGARGATVRVPVVDDALDEADEDFTLRLLDADNATIIAGTATATAIIADNDDPPSVSISPPTIPVREGETAIFALTLAQPSGKNISIAYATQDGTAEGGTGLDYTPTSGTLTIAAGTTTGEIRVVTSNDTLDEANETFTLSLTNPNNATIASNSTTATIADTNSPPVITLTAPTSATNEGEAAQFIITLDTASGKNISVDYTTQDLTATSPSDYTPTTGTLVIEAGETRGEIPVPVLTDSLDEADETFALLLTNPNNATLATGTANATATAIIADIDDAPTLTITPPASPVNEAGGGEAVFNITLSQPSGKNISVDYATENGTAVSASDYTATSGRVVIMAGATSARVQVPVLDDDLDEADETFALRLTRANNATIITGTGDSAMAIISDDDEAPTLTLTPPPASVVEGSPASFTLTLSQPSGKNISVDYATEDGTATSASPSDYTAITDTLIIPLGETTAQVPVLTTDDSLDEDTETFTLRITSPNNATIDNQAGNTNASFASVTASIADNDDPPAMTISASNSPVAEGDTALFTISLGAVSGKNISVEYATQNGTATSPSDYNATSGRLVIPAGAINGEVQVAIADDDDDEGDESVVMTLHNANNATLAGASATAIISDVPIGRVRLGESAISVDEGAGVATIPITLTPAQNSTVMVRVMTSDGTARAGSDYTAINEMITFEAGVTQHNLTLTINNDNLDEVNETLQVQLGDLNRGTTRTQLAVGATETIVTILDNDDPPSVRVSPPDSATNEGGMAVFTLTLAQPSAKNISVGYETRDGTAIAASDYTATTGAVFIRAGATTGEVRVPVLDDDLDEASETFALHLTRATNATIASDAGVAVAVINDTDGPPSVTIAPPLGAVDEGGVARFTLTLNATSGKNISIAYTTRDGTAEAGDDYTNTTGRLVITAGTTSAEVLVPVLNDDLDEANETFTLTLTNANNVTLATTTATATIADTDNPPSVSVSPPAGAVNEGGMARFTLTLNATSGKDVRVEYMTRDGTARVADDYSLTFGAVTIRAGETSGVVEVPVLTDLLDEADETFALDLTRAVNATIAPASDSATATIADTNDPPRLAIIPATSRPSEEGMGAWFNITLTTPSAKNISVDYATRDGTAVAGADYTTTTGTVAITAGMDLVRVWVPLLLDNLDEAEEEFTMRLTDATNATIATASNSAIATIADVDDPPSLTLTRLASPVREGEMARFAITLNATSGKNISVAYATEDGTARAGAGDYGERRGTLFIMAGETRGEVQVPVLTDLLDEDDEDFVLRIMSPVNATIATGGDTARVVIADTNPPPVLTITALDNPTAEGEMAVFRIALSARSAKNISVGYATNATLGNATSGVDYTETRGTLVIPAGSGEGEVAVLVADDTLDEGEEDFVMVLANPINATLAGAGGDAARASITDIPIGRIRLTHTAINVTEGAAAVVTLTLMPPQNDTVTLRATTADGTATAGDDYSAITNRLISFMEGETSKTIEIQTRDDVVDEVAEDLVLRLSDLNPGPTRTRLVDGEARIVIADNDKPSYVLTPDPDTINEGDRVSVTLTLTTPWEEATPLTLHLTTRPVSANSATAGADFVAVTRQPLIINQGDRSVRFTLATLADAVYEGNENFMLVVDDINDATANASPLARRITIIDDEATPSLAFIGNGTQVVEGNATDTPITLPLQLTGAVDSPVVVTLATLVGTATAGEDYVLPAPTLTIPRNTTRAEISIMVRGDVVDEFDESFAFGLATASHAIINSTGRVFTTTIIDDDPLPMITSHPSNASEGARVRFPITLSAPSAKLVSLGYATRVDVGAGDTATAGIDFTPQNASLRFPPGATEMHIEIATTLDLDIEDNETFTLTLTNPDNATLGTGSDRVQGLIIDTGVPLLSAVNATAIEGEDLAFVLQLSHPWIAPVVVEYETADGTARAGEDYVGRRGQLAIPAGATEVVLPVATISDDLDEVANETMRLLLSRADNAIITSNATGVIADDDGLPMMVLGGRNVIEGRNASFVITARGSRPIEDVTIQLEISPSASINASAVGVRNVTFGARSRQAVVEIMTLDNNVTGANEVVRATLMVGAGEDKYVLGSPATVEIRVLDDESISDIGDVANEAVLAQLITYMTERTTDVIGGRILGVLRFNGDGLSQVGGVGIPYGGREFVVDGQTLTGLAAREARREAAENPWDSPTSPSRLRESHDIYDLKFALPFAGLFADRFSMWGEGQYAEVSGGDDTTGVAYEGEIPGFVLGIDTRVSDNTIIGFSISQINSDFTIRTSNTTANTTNTTTARHRADITTLHPYVGWLIGDALRVWLAAGFGEGDLRITSADIGFDVETSVGLRLYSFGFDRALSSRGEIDEGGQITTYATGDIAVAELAVDAATDEDGWQSLQAQTLTTTTSRLAYTVRRMRQMATGIVTQEAEAIFRYDRGEAIEGAGLEIGGRLALSLNSGLHFNLSGRALLAHTGAAETDWGVSGGIRYSAQRGVGLAFAFMPEWGNPESGREAIWEADLAGLVSLAEGGRGRGLRYRLDVRYGIPLSWSGAGFSFGRGQNYNYDAVLTPFAIHHANRDINLGADFTWGRHFSAGYEVLLPEADAEASENSLSINYDRKF